MCEAGQRRRHLCVTYRTLVTFQQHSLTAMMDIGGDRFRGHSSFLSPSIRVALPGVPTAYTHFRVTDEINA